MRRRRSSAKASPLIEAVSRREMLRVVRLANILHHDHHRDDPSPLELQGKRNTVAGRYPHFDPVERDLRLARP
jgi:hypothetical protein